MISVGFVGLTLSAIYVWYIVSAGASVIGAGHVPNARRRGHKVVVTGVNVCASFSDRLGVMLVQCAHSDRLRRIVRGEYLLKAYLRVRGS